MEIILPTAFGVKAETQTVENDPITELAKKPLAIHPIIGIMRKKNCFLILFNNCPVGTAVLLLNLITIQFGTAEARRLNWAYCKRSVQLINYMSFSTLIF